MKNLDNVQIRPYTPEDYASVIELYKEGNLFEEEVDEEKIITLKITRDPESILVALKNNKIVGTVSIMEDGRLAFIFRLAVKANERRQGIGAALLAEVEKTLKKRGNTMVNIIVNEKQEDLQKYYEKLKYKKARVWRWMWKKL